MPEINGINGPLRGAAAVLKRLSVASEPWQLNLKCDAAFEFAFDCTATSCEQLCCPDAAHQTIRVTIDYEQSQRARRGHLFRNGAAGLLAEDVIVR